MTTETFGLNRNERIRHPEQHVEDLHACLTVVADKLNAELIELIPGNKEFDLVDKDCRVDMTAFWSKRGGPYKKESYAGESGVAEDLSQVRQQEIVFSQVDDERVQQYYEADSVDEALEKWREKEEQHDGGLAESLLYVILQKVLADDYIVVRSSKYDDYFNGVDTLVIDRKTGEMVCTFDEVMGLSSDDSRYQKKVTRDKKRIQSSKGATVKYGLSLQNEEGLQTLERTELDQLPGFALRIDKTDVIKILNEGSYQEGELTALELSLITQAMADVELELASQERVVGAALSHDFVEDVRAIIARHAEELA